MRASSNRPSLWALVAFATCAFASSFLSASAVAGATTSTRSKAASRRGDREIDTREPRSDEVDGDREGELRELRSGEVDVVMVLLGAQGFFRNSALGS